MFQSVTAIGRLGRDPELKKTNSGSSVANFSVATDYRYKDSSGDYQTKTEWFNVTAWSKLAENCAKYLKKGSLVHVEGRLETSTYEKDGETKYSTKLVASTVNFLDSKSSESGSYDESRTAAGAAKRSVPATKSGPVITDDDIPF